jgi:predicted ATPase
MNATFRISNYRCFPDHHPATIELSDGETAFVGVNNAGKSTLMRFFYEFRPLFAVLASSREDLRAALVGKRINFQRIDFSEHIENLFHNSNDKPITVTIKVDLQSYTSQARSAQMGLSETVVPKALEIEVERSSSEVTHWMARIIDGDDVRVVGQNVDVHEKLQKDTV